MNEPDLTTLLQAQASFQGAVLERLKNIELCLVRIEEHHEHLRMRVNQLEIDLGSLKTTSRLAGALAGIAAGALARLFPVH